MQRLKHINIYKMHGVEGPSCSTVLWRANKIFSVETSDYNCKYGGGSLSRWVEMKATRQRKNSRIRGSHDGVCSKRHVNVGCIISWLRFFLSITQHVYGYFQAFTFIWWAPYCSKGRNLKKNKYKKKTLNKKVCVKRQRHFIWEEDQKYYLYHTNIERENRI